MSFNNGCAFLGIYHIGVASALQYYLPNMDVKNICGASAGAWGAAALLGGMPLGKLIYSKLVLDRTQLQGVLE